MKKYLAFIRKKGLTLIELIVAIAIMAILATLVTAGALGISRSVEERNGKSAVRNYFSLSKAAMDQINSGVTVYSNGAYTTNSDISALLTRTTGMTPTVVSRLEDTQAADKARPFVTDAEGYYVAFRYADPKLKYPVASSTFVENDNRTFFLEAVYFVSGGKCYASTRTGTDVSVYK